jgi:SAM-dependent methyltransferase
MNTTLSFDGQIPRNYEDILTPFLFDPFSAELMEQIDFSNAHKVLELASGTGSLTRLLVKQLSAGAHLTATDLQAGMLEIARQQVNSAQVSWDAVDMTSIPYKEDLYDLIVCQFGLMLVPDKLTAISEMHRVLRKGGRLVFTVWSDIEDNPVWAISGKVIERFLGTDPMLQDPGPFSMADKEHTLQLLGQAGFLQTSSRLVTQSGTTESAHLAAKGFIQGLPVFMTIHKKDPALAMEIEQALALKLTSELGDLPMHSPLSARVFEAIK